MVLLPVRCIALVCRLAALLALFISVAYSGTADTQDGTRNLSPDATKPASSESAPTDDDEEPAVEEDKPEDIADEAFHALVTGKYATAKLLGVKLSGVPAYRERALWIQARALLESGNPNDAVKLLETADMKESKDVSLLAEYGYVLLAVGRYSDAERLGDQLVADIAVDPRGFWIKGEAQYRQGRHADATAICTQGKALGGNLKKPEKGGDADFNLAEQYWASGWCAYRANDLPMAQHRFDDAIDCFAKHAPAYLGLAQVFEETNKDQSAITYCEKIWDRINPNCAPARFWASQAYAFRWKGDLAKKNLDRAIRLNPWYVQALAYRAAFRILTDQYAEGMADIDRALAVNPNAIDALAAKALWAKTLGKNEEYDAIERRVLAFNVAPGEFYLVVGDGLNARLRVREAVDVYKKGLAAQPNLWLLCKGLGEAQLKFGEIGEGKKNLETAHTKDLLRNQAQTRNLLTLLDSYKDFEWMDLDDGHYRLLIHSTEKSVMLPLYSRFLEQTRKELREKYLGFVPHKPVTVESFNEHRDFSVRTTGLTGLPALGACFGEVVTLDSPSARRPGTYNWASTLRHEMDHVYQLQLSNGQCPRWLAEGCSVYEERRCRPEWERHMEEQLYKLYATDGIPKVKEFNEWFHDGSRVLFAYYLASIMVEFIVDEYGGYGPVITMIKEFALKKTPDEVFEKTLKIDAKAFDKRFAEFVGKKVGKIKLLPPVKVEEFEDLQENAEDGKADLEQLVTLARAHFQNGNTADARIWSGQAKKLGADTKELNYVLGMLVKTDQKIKDEDKAKIEKEYLTRSLNQGMEDFHLFMRMAEIAQGEKNGEAVVFYLNEARRAFPTNPAPLNQLYRFYMGDHNEERAHDIAEQAIMLDENNLQLRGWLLQRYQNQGDALKAADIAQQMIWVWPFEPKMHKARAEALRDLEDWEESITCWEMMRVVYASSKYEGPDALAGQTEALIGKARTWVEKGDMEKALDAAQDAKALSAADPRVRELLTEIEGDDKEEHFR